MRVVGVGSYHITGCGMGRGKELRVEKEESMSSGERVLEKREYPLGERGSRAIGVPPFVRVPADGS